jgi:hypothetical protein
MDAFYARKKSLAIVWQNNKIRVGRPFFKERCYSQIIFTKKIFSNYYAKSRCHISAIALVIKNLVNNYLCG